KIDQTKRASQLIPYLDRLAKTREFEALVPVSALTGRNLPELLNVVAQALPEGPPAYPEDQLTDRDERFFAAEMLREKIFETLGEDLPYRCEVLIDSFEEEGALRRIEATILVERDSQKAIVLGKGGERLKVMATAARKDLERLFEGKVYLGVWVKVRRSWTDDARVLRQLGYEYSGRNGRMKRRADHEPGYVLHTYPYKETSLIVEAFTRRHGRVALLARGARRPRSAMRG